VFQALEKRLQILDCTPQDLMDFTKAHPPSSRLTPGAVALISALQARDIEIYLISGGFRCAPSIESTITLDDADSTHLA
jgi:phosphoserine phosphatase